MIEKYIPKFLSCLYNDKIRDVIPAKELIDMFHTNQIDSIYEICRAFEAVRLQGMSTNALYIGSWMGFKTKLFSEYYGLEIKELELDERCKAVSEIWNSDNTRYRGHLQGDATKLDKEFYKDFKTVINPSCEHMTDEWYHNLAEGTMVILQSNDFWEVPEHINVVKNIEEMKKKYKMKDIYSCTLQCTVYQRFTLAGIKTAESILP